MKKKILLIDDSVTIHRVIDLCVDKDKYDVVKVFSKDEAAAALRAENPNLVLLDNKLADTKTIDMVQMIKSQCPGCYIILLAGAFDQFDKEQCMETGAEDFIYKPFDAKTLDAKVLCGMEGICDEMSAHPGPQVTEEEMEAIMPDAEESIPAPEFEEEASLGDVPEITPGEFQISEIENINIEEPEDIELGDFEGLKEIDELDILAGLDAETEKPEEKLEDAVDEAVPADEMELELDEPMAEEPEEIAVEDVRETVDESYVLLDPEPEVESGNPFDGLIETEERLEEEKPEEKVLESISVDVDEAAAVEENTDELDSILDDINEDEQQDTVDISDMIEDAEESLEESQEEIDMNESAVEMAELDIDSMFGDKDEADAPAEDAFEMPEIEGMPVMASEPEIEPEPESEPEFEDEPEIAQEKPVPADKPVISISDEKLVEAVYEAIDEDTLKFAIKEVLTDKITRILEEELPYLVEKAIRKEIERLVKGS